MKIIAYDDNPDFGGHQTMSCRGIEALTADPSNEIVFILNPDNRKLVEKITATTSCHIVESPCKTRRPQGIRNRMDRRDIARLELLLDSMHADLLLCIQGDIEQSSQALIAARRTQLPCVSYIALPHSMATMGAKLGTLRDRANRRLFNLPSRYIAISESMAERLRAQGVRQPIAIVPNGIDLSSTGPLKRQTSRFTLGMLGRTEFQQKQQDFMVQTFCSVPQLFDDCKLLLAGDGPDQAALGTIVSRCSRRADITLEPWQQDLDAFFGSIDLLVIPSRYEGMPLVMLEALARGIPVIGSNRDGMKDLLPAEWTFDPGDASALAEAVSCVRTDGAKHIGSLQNKVRAEHSLQAFKTHFVHALLQQ